MTLARRACRKVILPAPVKAEVSRIRIKQQMKEVSREQFKALYFKFGRAEEGWGQDYWDHFFEKEEQIPMKYVIEEPESPEHSRMMIVSDFAAREYRLFFLTEEAEESFFGR